MNVMPSTLAHTGPGQELVAGHEHGLRDRLSGFLALIRPIFFILTPLNAASAAVLALKRLPIAGTVPRSASLPWLLPHVPLMSSTTT